MCTCSSKVRAGPFFLLSAKRRGICSHDPALTLTTSSTIEVLCGDPYIYIRVQMKFHSVKSRYLIVTNQGSSTLCPPDNLEGQNQTWKSRAPASSVHKQSLVGIWLLAHPCFMSHFSGLPCTCTDGPGMMVRHVHGCSFKKHLPLEVAGASLQF